MGLKVKLIMVLVLSALCGVIYYQYQEHNALVAEKAKVESVAEQRKLTIATMAANAQTQAATLKQLAAKQRDLQTQHNQREQLIRGLQRENQQYKNWATTELPNLVKRLRQRPALTGSSEYREWLSHTNTLLSASGAAPSYR